MKAVTLLSGGLDSTTLAYYMKLEYEAEIIAVSFDYGQRHKKELDTAVTIAERLGAEHHIVAIGVGQALDDDLAPLGSIFGSSSLTNEALPVPDGHYAHENMKQTIVPNRNAIMLAIAYGIAVDRGAALVSFAAHSGDHAIYPDCRPDFVEALDKAFKIGNAWADPLPDLVGPFLEWEKSEIALRAFERYVPLDVIAQTWSCYKGGDYHCGTCGTCYERREAFELAGVVDPTVYLDNTTRFSAPE